MTPILDHGHSFDVQNLSLESCSNGGLFSNFYHTLWSIVDLHNQGLLTRDITFKQGNKMFRDSAISDLFPYLFQIDEKQLDEWLRLSKSLGRLPRLDHHGVYALYPYAIFSPIMQAYFGPSAEVQEILRAMRSKHELDKVAYAAFYYRGTDKHTEVSLPDVEAMIASVKQAMERSGLSRCLVQTDDAAVLRLGLERIPGAFFLEELPVSEGQDGFHFENAEQEIIPPVLFSQRLLAMTHVLADSAALTLPVSNLAGWVCLIRGNTDNVIQFNKHGSAVTPLYHLAFLLKNHIRRIRAKLANQRYYYI